MNFIPKEIKESLDYFRQCFKKLFFTTTSTADVNFSKIFKNVKECNCIGNFCQKNCPNIPQTEIIIDSNSKHLQDFILCIKSLNMLTNIKNALYCLTISIEKENKNIILFKGLINDYLIKKKNYSFPLKLYIPNKITFKIVLIDENDVKNFSETNNILDMGVIDFGLIFL